MPIHDNKVVNSFENGLKGIHNVNSFFETFGDKISTKKCTSLNGTILEAGGKGYEVKWRPKTSFEYAIETLNIEEKGFK